MNINSYNITTTRSYCAPELRQETNPKIDRDNEKEFDPNLKINIEKAMSFTCGKLIENIYKMRKGNSDKEFWAKV